MTEKNHCKHYKMEKLQEKNTISHICLGQKSLLFDLLDVMLVVWSLGSGRLQQISLLPWCELQPSLPVCKMNKYHIIFKASL